MAILGAAALAAGVFLLSARGRGADEGEPYANIVNVPAPAWTVQGWINSKPLTLEKLRGKAVLIRWWTGPGCPYCAPSAPTLNELFHRYKNRGLVVIGFYHHKSQEPLRAGDVSRLAKEMGMDFPVAVDAGWRTLRRYWLDRVEGEPWT
ncbi:MAG: redoxin domain-containing protein, partial [Elusimicrobia bacterium]|nr:redoxin domain-containing protein [Elusimicrobiota bacterium]